MKIFELKRDRVYDIGFIDPNTIYEKVLKEEPKDTEANLLMFLKELNAIPYNFK